MSDNREWWMDIKVIAMIVALISNAAVTFSKVAGHDTRLDALESDIQEEREARIKIEGQMESLRREFDKSERSKP